VFQLGREVDRAVAETADITFYTPYLSGCLVACFDYALCKVAVYHTSEDMCQLFMTLGVTGLTKTYDDRSDVYFRTCQGELFKILF